MLPDTIQSKYTLILASASPRRRMLLEQLGFKAETRESFVDESFDPRLNREEIPCFLAKKKADSMRDILIPRELLITADTIVWLHDEALNKPANAHEAKEMLFKLSGQKHEVITAVCLTSFEKQTIFHAITEVWFDTLTEGQIDYYIEHFKPYDKAGAYGIQEWIGYVGISKINGCFFNVMGLPLSRLYNELMGF